MKYKFILFSVLVAGFTSACSSDDEFQELVEKTSGAITSTMLDTISVAQSDSIIPIEG